MAQGFGQSFTLAEIAERAGLSTERLRYVIDSGILPGAPPQKTRSNRPGRGIPRQFLRHEAIALVAVVLMLEGGVRRQAVRDCLDLLATTTLAPESKLPRDNLLLRVLTDETIIALEIGDGLNVRLIYTEGVVKNSLPRDWIQPKTAAKLREYEPLLTLKLNLQKLRTRFCN